MITSQEILPVGTFRKTHGKQGELCLTAEAFPESLRPQFVVVTLDGINVPFVVQSFRQHGADYLLCLEDIDSEERARMLQGKPVAVLRRELPADYEEQLPVSGLIGFSVMNEKQQRLGTITDVDDQTANILIRLDNDLVLPLHDDLVEELSIEQRYLVMTLPEGLVAMDN